MLKLELKEIEANDRRLDEVTARARTFGVPEGVWGAMVLAATQAGDVSAIDQLGVFVDAYAAGQDWRKTIR